MAILVYQDYVHNNGSLFKALVGRYGAGNVLYADAGDIINGILDETVKAFFMPGGASRYVADKLDGDGNRNIKTYVAQGGVYVGICAGAYYACRRTEWMKGQSDEICVDNELGFFPGTASGPVYFPPACSIPAVIAVLVDDKGDTWQKLYWGGPLFEAKSWHDIVVWARYAALPDKPPAIISGELGKGRYLLCSPHLEMDATMLELMQFDVNANRFEELNGLKFKALENNYFFHLLERFVQ